MILKPLPEKLPFHLRKETILPTNKVREFTNTLTESRGGYQFWYQGPDADLSYEVNIVQPVGGISVIYKGERKSIDTGAEIVFENRTPVQWSINSRNLAGDTLFVRYKAKGKGISEFFDCYYTVRQKSLIWGIEEKSATGRVEEIRLGKGDP